MLLRFKTVSASCLFTDMEELANLVAKFGEPSVGRKGYIHVGKNTLNKINVLPDHRSRTYFPSFLLHF